MNYSWHVTGLRFDPGIGPLFFCFFLAVFSFGLVPIPLVHITMDSLSHTNSWTLERIRGRQQD